MDNGLKIRAIVFEELMKDGDNRRNWEMLCCSEKPLVPFVGAGLSAWCYPVWKELLIDITKESFSPECAYIVEQALGCDNKPSVKNQDDFHWMEEIGECIFGSGDYSEKFGIDPDERSVDRKKENEILNKLRTYVGGKGQKEKSDAEQALYRAFDPELLKEKRKIPEYQKLLHRLFRDILVTTNYDKALEFCYPSILSYSCTDLKKSDTEEERSWLFEAVMAKLRRMEREKNGREPCKEKVTVPDIPMLLKVHGSIERADQIVLSRSNYEEAYSGEMPELLSEIFKESTLLFMGCSLKEDRILEKLKEVKDQNKDTRHFAFLPKNEKDAALDLTKDYQIYPIYYDSETLKPLMNSKGDENIYHDYFLGLLLENLSRRMMQYPQPLEFLWDEDRFDDMELNSLLEKAKKRSIKAPDREYIRREQAARIWKRLNSPEECSLIAVIGERGSGKSTLCKSIMDIHKNYKLKLPTRNLATNPCSYLPYPLNYAPVDISPEI